jgi:ADP-ribose pyrophosphatase YjhB (NUDIX family)
LNFNNELYVLVIQRVNSPHQGSWSFSVGFVDMDEEIEEAAYR